MGGGGTSPGRPRRAAGEAARVGRGRAPGWPRVGEAPPGRSCAWGGAAGEDLVLLEAPPGGPCVGEAPRER